MVCATCKKVFRADDEAPGRRAFCSERCRMADLGRWLSGDYRITESVDEVDDDGARGGDGGGSVPAAADDRSGRARSH